MSKDHDDEPIFIRSNWGTSRYVYNPRNPVGAGLIIGSLLFAAGGIFYLYASSSWSEGELRDAVRVAVRNLESEPQTLGSWTGGYDSMIRDALEESGEGPSNGGVVYVEDADNPYDEDADRSVDRFEVTAKDVDAAFCLSVSPPEPEPGLTSIQVSLSITVEEGDC
ncbi:hypothetical protein [Streptomyces sp. SID14515]|uniref:hypothetical protein n=1 Tax=Streptomyces sp. SID14515 TaxID=2706074 RepID=UPI0013C6E750|nr:hypothetical protein [Streptomyces sp. SID14515]NEB35992.1 hypothetical protein [Streptomyces sp. SID14515]